MPTRTVELYKYEMGVHREDQRGAEIVWHCHFSVFNVELLCLPSAPKVIDASYDLKITSGGSHIYKGHENSRTILMFSFPFYSHGRLYQMRNQVKYPLDF